MLDFTVESPTRFLNELVSLAQPGKTARAAGDRRSAAPATPSASIGRKRRRNDGLNNGKLAPLQW
jgi:hypothetical protein